jgi:NADH-quinone oxidoreductase subunit C
VSTFALDQLQAQLPDAVAGRTIDRHGDAWGIIKPDQVAAVARLLKEKLTFRLFLSMDAVDRLALPPDQQEPRFEVVYFLRSIARNEVVRLKVLVAEGAEVQSIRGVFQGANWAERFVWDFYGIAFHGHGDLRRLLMYEEFQGHPLRKDYPLRGRQGLIPERPLKDIFRGPGTNGVAD